MKIKKLSDAPKAVQKVTGYPNHFGTDTRSYERLSPQAKKEKDSQAMDFYFDMIKSATPEEYTQKKIDEAKTSKEKLDWVMGEVEVMVEFPVGLFHGGRLVSTDRKKLLKLKSAELAEIESYNWDNILSQIENYPEEYFVLMLNRARDISDLNKLVSSKSNILLRSHAAMEIANRLSGELEGYDKLRFCSDETFERVSKVGDWLDQDKIKAMHEEAVFIREQSNVLQKVIELQKQGMDDKSIMAKLGGPIVKFFKSHADRYGFGKE